MLYMVKFRVGYLVFVSKLQLSINANITILSFRTRTMRNSSEWQSRRMQINIQVPKVAVCGQQCKQNRAGQKSFKEVTLRYWWWRASCRYVEHILNSRIIYINLASTVSDQFIDIKVTTQLGKRCFIKHTLAKHVVCINIKYDNLNCMLISYY